LCDRALLNVRIAKATSLLLEHWGLLDRLFLDLWLESQILVFWLLVADGFFNCKLSDVLLLFFQNLFFFSTGEKLNFIGNSYLGRFKSSRQDFSFEFEVVLIFDITEDGFPLIFVLLADLHSVPFV